MNSIEKMQRGENSYCLISKLSVIQYSESEMRDMKLFFYRCEICLNVASTQEQAKECFCGGLLSFMGYTKRDPKVLLDTSLATPCSTLCTDAAGPCCNCACGGAHHGTGRMVEVERVVGQAPKLKSVNQKSLDRAAEFLALTDYFNEYMTKKFGNPYSDYKVGTFISRDTWIKVHQKRRQFNLVSGYKVHSKRIKGLKELMEIA